MRATHFPTGLVLGALLAAAAMHGPARAQAPAAPAVPATSRITTSFRDTDITQVADAVAIATGKTFIVDPRVRAQVNLISSTPMTPNELYAAFLSILQVHGFAAVPSGNLVKIIPEANVRAMPGLDLPSRSPDAADEMVTQVVPVRNANAAQLVQVLRPFVATYGQLGVAPGSNVIIISDRASNVDRFVKIVRRIDQAGDSNIEIIQLQNSGAADVVRTLSALNAGQPAEAAGLAPKIVADDRSNSVIISGEASQRLRLAALVASLDTPLENGGDTEVIYLRYADAEKLAPKLKEQLTGIAQATGGPAPAGGAAAPAGGGSARAGEATIWAEAENNALIITAPPKTMRSLKQVISKLDIRRPQVLVEAIIVDVSVNKSADLGVNWAVWSNESDTNVPAGSFVAPVGTANQQPSSLVDLARIALNPENPGNNIPLGTTFAIGRVAATGVNFAAMIRALRSDANTNVIATPSATTMDNQETELKVAQEVPFITGQYTTSTGGQQPGGSPTPFTTVEREEVGTILKITPQISSETNDAVMLKIELESSELANATGDANSLITNKRTINTHVLIEDGGIVVLGGLIRDSSLQGETRVPFLGRIPVIGEAFKVRSAQRVKQNLMVFIRPKILRDGMQTAIETNSKYNAIRLQQLQQPRGEVLPLLPGDKVPVLPPAPALPAPGEQPTPKPNTPPAGGSSEQSAPAAPAPDAPAPAAAPPP